MTQQLMFADRVKELSQAADPEVDEWIKAKLVRQFRQSGGESVRITQPMSRFPLEYLKSELERRLFKVHAYYAYYDSPPKHLTVSFPSD